MQIARTEKHFSHLNAGDVVLRRDGDVGLVGEIRAEMSKDNNLAALVLPCAVIAPAEIVDNGRGAISRTIMRGLEDMN